MEKVLARLQGKGLTLNKEKCVFHMSQITFMGLVLSQRGIGPTQENFKTVHNAREPESPSEVKSFLGLANYNAWFIPNFATMAEPLRQLMKKGVPFKFSRTQREAFPELKRRLTHAETVGYFNKDVSMYTFYGFEFEMYTYHKPLETIYSTRSKPCARIE